MTRRRLVAVSVIGATLALGVAAALAASLGTGSPTTSREASGPGSYTGSQVVGGIKIPDFTLRNYDGRVVQSSDLDGRVTLLTFLDSQCTESCPVIAWTIARTIEMLTPAERKEVRAVAISTDPGEDTDSSVRSFLRARHALGHLLYLGGGEPVRELRMVWGEFDVLSSFDSGEDALHSAPVRIYDRSGEWVTTLHAGADLTEANLAHDVRVALGGEQ
jgi:cytochrome oxidase Cu insertion factor (SCO1/SenC/PrrC family)